MINHKSNLSRIDPEFERIMRDVMFHRANVGLAKKTTRAMSLREATYLARTAPSFPKVLFELKTLRKRPTL
jgi:hypothetical protein